MTALLVAAIGVGLVAAGSRDDPSPSTARAMPCDPGGGFPKPNEGCPETSPETGWLVRTPYGALRLKPFHTLGNDAEGEAYARDHDLEFPFSNDYFDAPAGAAQAIELRPDTVCTGIIRVHHEGPMEDQVVGCELVVAAAERLPVAVWRKGVRVIQVSELYRP